MAARPVRRTVAAPRRPSGCSSHNLSRAAVGRLVEHALLEERQLPRAVLERALVPACSFSGRLHLDTDEPPRRLSLGKSRGACVVLNQAAPRVGGPADVVGAIANAEQMKKVKGYIVPASP